MAYTQDRPVLHRLDIVDTSKSPLRLIIIGVVLVIAGGIISGYFLSLYAEYAERSSQTSLGGVELSDGKGKSYGIKDEKTFRDMAEGKIEKGGINGEGTHKLIRPGGESQTVYLTSSVLDLNKFVGKKVRVWGETFAAKKAGWLMDVGRVEIVDD